MSGPYYTPEQVAERFGLETPNYINENASRWPHIKIARRIRFTEDHIAEIARRHLVEPPPTTTTTGDTFDRRTRGGGS